MNLEGVKIRLRPLVEADFERFYELYSDEKVTRYLGMKPLTREQAENSFEQIMRDENGAYFGIVRKMDVYMVGYVFLTDILRRHRVAREFGIVIGGEENWGRGYGTEATSLILRHGFKEMSLHRVELLVIDFNERARRVYRKLGFEEEGVQRKARLVDGEWRDVVMMALLEDDLLSVN